MNRHAVVSVLFFLVVGVFPVNLAWSAGHVFTVRSEYASPVGNQWLAGRMWAFNHCVPERLVVYGNGSIAQKLLSFRLDAEQEIVAVRIEDAGIGLCGHPLSGGYDTVILSHGSPVPYDYLGGKLSCKERNVVARNSIAGMVTAQKYVLKAVLADLDDVQTRGYISRNIVDDVGGRVHWVNLYDERGNRVLRQLWCDSVGWWLYEETVQRRSWLVAVSRCGEQ